MNGINYSTLMSNIGLFSNRTTGKDETGFNGKAVGREPKEPKDGEQIREFGDTYEHGAAQEVKAGYDKPPVTQPKEEQQQYKAIDSDGIQEGVELSDAAKSLLKELQEKYGDTMDIAVAVWSTDEEQDYYASLTDKEYSVLISPELLEEMAADESVREQYESILDNASGTMDAITEELGEDVASRIKSVSITVDADGNVSYAVKLLQDMAEQSKKTEKTSSEEQQERIEKRREEKKAEEKERKEKLQEERIEAGSIEELIAAIKERLNITDTDNKIVISEADLEDEEAAVAATANADAE